MQNELVGNTLITILQSLQLVGLAPSLFVMAFLLLTARHLRKSIVPVLFFLTLSSSFLLPLSDILPLEGQTAHGSLLFIQSMFAAVSFLLVIQFLRGDIPSWPYWMILALPVVGGGPLVYGLLFVDELCFTGNQCVSVLSIKALYNIFAASSIFLLLIMQFTRSELYISKTDPNRLHKYWLIIALVVLNLALLAIDLAWVADMIRNADAQLAGTIIRLVFIYLVLMSLFRVFDKGFEVDFSRIPTARRTLQDADGPQLARIRQLMEEEHAYREMGMSREAMAERLGMPQHLLSRLINTHFKKNYNEFLNEYRVTEAKQRLRNESTSVTAIAFEVGFSSIASFNRVFKNIVGMSPTEYRSKK